MLSHLRVAKCLQIFAKFAYKVAEKTFQMSHRQKKLNFHVYKSDLAFVI
jgi:hypothetical protein